MIKVYRDGNQTKTINKDITLRDFVESGIKDFDLVPGMRIVLEQKTMIFNHDGQEEDTKNHSFWIGDATPYHGPSDNDAEEGWYQTDWDSWNVVGIYHHSS